MYRRWCVSHTLIFMSDSKQTDHWDQLASALGAEPQKKEPGEPILQAEEKKTETTEDIIIDDIIEDIIKDADAKASVAEPPGEPAAASLAPTLSNWDALAMKLGIEVKPEPPRRLRRCRRRCPNKPRKRQISGPKSRKNYPGRRLWNSVNTSRLLEIRSRCPLESRMKKAKKNPAAGAGVTARTGIKIAPGPR